MSHSNKTSKTDLDDNGSSNLSHQSFSRSRFSKSARQDKNKMGSKNSSSNVPENNDAPEILNISSSSSKYSRVLPSMAMQSSSNNGARHNYTGHRRNVSNMSGKPLITSDSYSSTSDISECCSDDNNENNTDVNNRPRHFKHKNNKSTPTDQQQRGGAAGNSSCIEAGRNDGSVLRVVRAKYRHGDTSSHIIHIDGDDEYDVANDGNENDPEIKYGDVKIPNEPLKTFVAAILLFMAFIATTASLAFVHDRVPFEYDPLPDVILDNVKYQHWGLDASEILLMTLVWTTVLITIFHKHRFIVYRRIFLIGGLHYFYRAITMALTVLPVADKAYRDDICQPQSNQTSAFVMGQRVLTTSLDLTTLCSHGHCHCRSGHLTHCQRSLL